MILYSADLTPQRAAHRLRNVLALQENVLGVWKAPESELNGVVNGAAMCVGLNNIDCQYICRLPGSLWMCL